MCTGKSEWRIGHSYRRELLWFDRIIEDVLILQERLDEAMMAEQNKNFYSVLPVRFLKSDAGFSWLAFLKRSSRNSAIIT